MPQLNIYEKYIEWLDSHDGKMPRSEIKKDGKILKVSEMTEEEYYEISLQRKWVYTKEYAAFMNAKGIPINELPDELQSYKDKIIKLRQYSLERERPRGIKNRVKQPKKEEIKEKEEPVVKFTSINEQKQIKMQKEEEMYKKVINWLDSHDGMMVRSSIRRNGDRVRLNSEMSAEEIYEKSLYTNWALSDLYKALKKCIGIPLEDLPVEYKKYKENFRVLRSYNLGIPEENFYKRITNWLQEHNGEMPRSEIVRQDGTMVNKMPDMTQEERDEKKLRNDWENSYLKAALEKCEGIEIDELSIQYCAIKKYIAILRQYGYGVAKSAEEIMRESAEKYAYKNDEARHKLYLIIQEIEGKVEK